MLESAKSSIHYASMATLTRGAKQALTFVTDNSLYLVVANSYDSSQLTGDTSSTLYQWSAVNTR